MSNLPMRGPRIRELSDRQIRSVLARNHVGRLAYTGSGKVQIMPLHYVYAESVIYGRTSVGLKYVDWLLDPEIAFEVDESEGMFDWRSVIVQGRLATLRAQGSGADPGAYYTAVDAIRKILPETMTERDPVPHRRVIFRIEPSCFSGREATSR